MGCGEARRSVRVLVAGPDSRLGNERQVVDLNSGSRAAIVLGTSSAVRCQEKL